MFRGSEIFSCRYFVVPKCLFRRYFVGQTFFLVGISWVPNFSRGCFVDLKYLSWVFHGSSIKKSDRKQKYINTSQTTHSIPNRFQQLQALSFVPLVFLVICFQLFFISLLVTVINSYYKTGPPQQGSRGGVHENAMYMKINKQNHEQIEIKLSVLKRSSFLV